MAKADSKVPVKAKNPTKQKIVVAQGRALGSPVVPFKVLHTETAVDAAAAKERVKEEQEKLAEDNKSRVEKSLRKSEEINNKYVK